jgi:hypothetical protein
MNTSSSMFLNTVIHRTIKAPGDQGRIVAMAVALAVAATAPLPSTPVDDASEYFLQQVNQQAIELISELNESVIFASKLALEFTQQFWKQRYYSAHPKCMIESNFTSQLDSLLNVERVETFDFSTIMSGGLFVLALDTVRFLNKYKVEIAKVTAAVYSAIAPDEATGE